jgi:hypothetical protein
MAGIRDDVFAAKPAAPRRQPSWHAFTPFVWAPVMYTLRFALKGRVTSATQHKIFGGAVLGALSHAGFVMSSDSTV